MQNSAVGNLILLEMVRLRVKSKDYNTHNGLVRCVAHLFSSLEAKHFRSHQAGILGTESESYWRRRKKQMLRC